MLKTTVHLSLIETRLLRTETLWVWVSPASDVSPEAARKKNKQQPAALHESLAGASSLTPALQKHKEKVFLSDSFLFFSALSPLPSSRQTAFCAVQTGSSIQIRPQRPFFFFTAPVFVLQSCRGSWEVSLWCCAAAQHIDWSSIGG